MFGSIFLQSNYLPGFFLPRGFTNKFGISNIYIGLEVDLEGYHNAGVKSKVTMLLCVNLYLRERERERKRIYQTCW